MKYLVLYENFISKSLGKIWNKLTEPSEHGDLIDAYFDHKEEEKLEEYGFNILTNIAEYQSNMNDLKITIKKYWDEEFPGYAPKLYAVSVKNSDKYYSKEFSDLDKLMEFIQNIIPEEELDAKKYNL
jgi:hypothetical protein